MANKQVANPFERVTPGNIDGLNKVYPSVAVACEKIPNIWIDVEEDGVTVSRNLREGKVVQIGTVTDHKEYRWIGGFEDGNLVEYIKREFDRSGGVFRTEIYSNIPANLVSYLVDNSIWGNVTSVMTTLTGFKAVNLIHTSPNSSFVIKGLTQVTLNSGVANFARLYKANGDFIASIAITALVTIPGGHRLPIPANSEIDSIGIFLPNGDAANIEIYTGFSFPSLKIKPDLLPAEKTKLSQYSNDVGFVTGENVVTPDEVFDQTPIPPNLITQRIEGKYYSTSASSLATNVAYDATNLIPATPGAVFAIQGLNTSLSNNSIGASFGTADGRISSITPQMLTVIPNGHRLTLPSTAGVTRLGLHFNTGEFVNIVVQAGPDVILPSSDNKIKDAVISGKKMSLFNNDSGYIGNNEYEEIKLSMSDLESDEIFNRGRAEKIYAPKKFALLVAGQSQVNGRIDFSELPQTFIDAATFDGTKYTLPGVKYWNTTSGPFVDFSVNNNSMWPWDLFLYHSLTDYLRTKKSDPSYEMYVIKDSQGGTSIAENGEGTGRWTPYFERIASNVEALLKRFEKRIRTANSSAQASLYDIRAFVWDQGEGDRNVANEYYQNLKNLIRYVRGVVNNPKLPVVIIGMNINNTQYNAIVDAAKRKIASEDYYCTYVEVANGASYMKSDSIHVNALGGKDRSDKTLNIIKDIEPQTNTWGGQLS